MAEAINDTVSGPTRKDKQRKEEMIPETLCMLRQMKET